MSDYKQCSDAAQKGPGVGSFNPNKTNTPTFSGGVGSAGNTKSGSSQGHSRGKQG